jgi:hypothetical protein
MKKYIREMLQDLIGKRPKGHVPPQAVPGDLENQELSKNPLQRTRQLDFQAQQDEERETS